MELLILLLVVVAVAIAAIALREDKLFKDVNDFSWLDMAEEIDIDEEVKPKKKAAKKPAKKAAKKPAKKTAKKAAKR